MKLVLTIKIDYYNYNVFTLSVKDSSVESINTILII
jgi:hypothetical protein